MARIRQVRKEDGTLVPFRERKIVEATLMALRAAGCDDARLAEDLSGAVILFLEKHYGKEPPRLDDVEAMLLKVLRETGHADAAVHYESLQRRRRELEAELQVVQSMRATGGAVYLEDAPLATPWDRERLVTELESSGRIPAGLAEEVGGAVEGLLIRSGLRTVSTRLLAEIRDSELRRRGFEPLEPAGERFEVRRSDIESCLESAVDGETDFSGRMAGKVLEPWALSTIHDSATSRAHEQGRIHLHGLRDPFRIERLVLPAHLALATESTEKPCAWEHLLALGRCLERLRPHVRNEVHLPDLCLAIAESATAQQLPRLARELLALLDHRDAFRREQHPRSRLVIPLCVPDSRAEGAIPFVRELIAALEASGPGEGEGVPVDLVHVSEWMPLEPELVQRAIEVTRMRRAARLGIARPGDPPLLPRDELPYDLRLGVARIALNFPLSVIDSFEGPVSEVIQDLEVPAERVRCAFLEAYWVQRRTPHAGLQAIMMALGGPERVQIPAQNQEVDLELWGLQPALALLVRRGIISPGQRPETAARLLGFFDYALQDPAEGIAFRVRLGGPLERGVRARFLEALDAWSERFDQPEVLTLLERSTPERRNELTLPVVLPLLGGGNRALLEASFAQRFGPGMALPFSAFDAEAVPDLLDRLAKETKLGTLSLEPLTPGESVFELQGELFS